MFNFNVAMVPIQQLFFPFSNCFFPFNNCCTIQQTFIPFSKYLFHLANIYSIQQTFIPFSKHLLHLANSITQLPLVVKKPFLGPLWPMASRSKKLKTWCSFKRPISQLRLPISIFKTNTVAPRHLDINNFKTLP